MICYDIDQAEIGKDKVILLPKPTEDLKENCTIDEIPDWWKGMYGRFSLKYLDISKLQESLDDNNIDAWFLRKCCAGSVSEANARSLEERLDRHAEEEEEERSFGN